MGLFEELSRTFPLENVYPYGLVVVVPKEAFEAGWEQQLKAEGVQIYTNSYEGRVCFFLRKKNGEGVDSAQNREKEAEKRFSEVKQAEKRKRLEWTEEELEALKRMRAEGVGLGEIAKRLGRSKGSVLGKLRALKRGTSNSKIERSRIEFGNPEMLFQEFLKVVQTLYPRHKRVCVFLLKEAVKILEASS